MATAKKAIKTEGALDAPELGTAPSVEDQLRAERERNDALEARLQQIETDLTARGGSDSQFKVLTALGAPKPREEVEAWLAKDHPETHFYSKTPGVALLNTIPPHEITNKFGQKKEYPSLDVTFRKHRGVGTELLDPDDRFNASPLIAWGFCDVAAIDGVVDKPQEACGVGEYPLAVVLEEVRKRAAADPVHIFPAEDAVAKLRSEYAIAYAQQDKRERDAQMRAEAAPGRAKMGRM